VKIPQKDIRDDDMETLVRAMSEALRFLTIEAPGGARYQNKMRVENATEVLSIALSPYKVAIEDLHERDAVEARKFDKRQRLS
jgi:hypothetical protein